MFVIYQGKSKCLMTDYNGKRLCFEKGKPVEIPNEIYSFMLKSHHVDVDDLVPVTTPAMKPDGEQAEKPVEAKEEHHRKPGRPKK